VLKFQTLRLTLCTASLKILQFYVLPAMHLCVLCGSENRQRLFLYKALTLSLLMLYKYGAPSKARNLTYIYGRDILLGILLLEP
jgi:hypothetical protein